MKIAASQFVGAVKSAASHLDWDAFLEDVASALGLQDEPVPVVTVAKGAAGIVIPSCDTDAKLHGRELVPMSEDAFETIASQFPVMTNVPQHYIDKMNASYERMNAGHKFQPLAINPDNGDTDERVAKPAAEASTVGHVVEAKLDGGSWGIFINGRNVIWPCGAQWAADRANVILAALSLAPPSDAETRAEEAEARVASLETLYDSVCLEVSNQESRVARAEARVTELEAELAKRPGHRVDVVKITDGRWDIWLNGAMLYTYDNPYFAEKKAKEIRDIIAAGPNASKELEELRSKVKSLDAELSRLTLYIQ